MSTPTWGLDPKARRISVYYTEASTIYEGMPVCYDFDTTDNWMGVDGSKIDFTTTASTSGLESTSTAESYQNEGKFIYVENVDNTNKMWFAGVVAGGDHVGQVGPRAIDIYIPNGAIVPVRTDLYCTVGRTVLALKTGVQHLTVPLDSGQCRSVAVAMETADRTTAGLVLAELNPSRFIYQDNTGDTLLIDDEDSADIVLNRINVESIQTTGRFTGLTVNVHCSGGASASGYGMALDACATVSATPNTHVSTSTHWLNLTGGTPACNMCALEAGIWCSGDATLSSVEVLSPLYLTTEVPAACAPTDKSHVMMYFRSQGPDHPDGWFKASSATCIAYTADTTGTNQSGAIKFYIGGTAHYLHTFSATAGAT